MKTWTHIQFGSILLLAMVVLGDAGNAQSVVYAADGFEAPRFKLGKLAGSSFYDGQDQWLATADIYHDVNYNGIVIQNNTVKHGAQAGQWDASQMDFSYAHLRRNTVFDPQKKRVEVLLDIYLHENKNRSKAWGLDIYGGPAFRLAWWTVRSGDRVHVMDNEWKDTGFVVKRNTWYSTRTVLDFKTFKSTVYVDNLPIYTSDFIDKCPGFGFASIFLDDPGEDMMSFDNFVVGFCSDVQLSTDTHTLSEKGGKVNFFIEASQKNAGNYYILLGSATGTSPGTPLPGGETLPISWDLLTTLNAALLNTPLFDDFLGALNASGVAKAVLDTQGPLGPGIMGLNLHFAYAVDTGGYAFAPSNPVSITIVR